MSQKVGTVTLCLLVGFAAAASAQDGAFTNAVIGKDMASGDHFIIGADGFTPRVPRTMLTVATVSSLQLKPGSVPSATDHGIIRFTPSDVQEVFVATVPDASTRPQLEAIFGRVPPAISDSRPVLPIPRPGRPTLITLYRDPITGNVVTMPTLRALYEIRVLPASEGYLVEVKDPTTGRWQEAKLLSHSFSMSIPNRLVAPKIGEANGKYYYVEVNGVPTAAPKAAKDNVRFQAEFVELVDGTMPTFASALGSRVLPKDIRSVWISPAHAETVRRSIPLLESVFGQKPYLAVASAKQLAQLHFVNRVAKETVGGRPVLRVEVTDVQFGRMLPPTIGGRAVQAIVTGPRFLRRPGPQDRAGSVVGREAVGAAQFAAAYLLKEAVKAVETGDREQMKIAVGQLATPGFWGSLAAFTAAARLAEVGVTKLGAGAFTTAAVPLAAGMAAVQLVSGRFSGQDLLVGTSAYLASGYLTQWVATDLLAPLLFRASPPGLLAGAAFKVTTMAASLYFGEKLEHWLHGLLGHRQRVDVQTTSAPQQGVVQAIEGLSN